MALGGGSGPSRRSLEALKTNVALGGSSKLAHTGLMAAEATEDRPQRPSLSTPRSPAVEMPHARVILKALSIGHVPHLHAVQRCARHGAPEAEDDAIVGVLCQALVADHDAAAQGLGLDEVPRGRAGLPPLKQCEKRGDWSDNRYQHDVNKERVATYMYA